METIRKGSKGESVKKLQLALGIKVDGIFGINTDTAVRKFQKSKGLVVDGIVGPKTWAALNVNETKTVAGLKKSTRNIKEIIVHCAATPEGKDYTVETIKKWHLQRGFSDIGYHYIIYRDGSIHNGRDVNIAGAHCVNHNSISIGICYIGGCAKDGKTPKDTRTDAQKKTMLELLKNLKVLYPNAKIHSHRDFANKACPSFDATKEYKNI